MVKTADNLRLVGPHNMDFSLTFNDNGTGHRDIVLCFAGQKWICDSYYFVIDGELLPEAEDERKIRLVLKRLLEQWLQAIQTLKSGEIAYLPYDFSDQYTGWLRCTRTPNGYLVAQGWSSVEGWSFSPSSVGDLLHHLDGFRSDGPELELEASDFTAAIIRSASYDLTN